MKEIDVSPELAARADLARVVEAANPILEEAIGEPAGRVTAAWDIRFRNEDERLPLLQLTLTDKWGSACGEFTPEELRRVDDARWRFIRLWGELLQQASRRQLKVLETIESE